MKTCLLRRRRMTICFLTTSKFKFLDVKNYIGPGLSYNAWCKSKGCRLQKLMFAYKWLDSYEKLSHLGPVSYEDFYSSQNPPLQEMNENDF